MVTLSWVSLMTKGYNRHQHPVFDDSYSRHCTIIPALLAWWKAPQPYPTVRHIPLNGLHCPACICPPAHDQQVTRKAKVIKCPSGVLVAWCISLSSADFFPQCNQLIWFLIVDFHIQCHGKATGRIPFLPQMVATSIPLRIDILFWSIRQQRQYGIRHTLFIHLCGTCWFMTWEVHMLHICTHTHTHTNRRTMRDRLLLSFW